MSDSIKIELSADMADALLTLMDAEQKIYTTDIKSCPVRIIRIRELTREIVHQLQDNEPTDGSNHCWRSTWVPSRSIGRSKAIQRFLHDGCYGLYASQGVY